MRKDTTTKTRQVSHEPTTTLLGAECTGKVLELDVTEMQLVASGVNRLQWE